MNVNMNVDAGLSANMMSHAGMKMALGLVMALLVLPGIASAACSIGANPLRVNMRASPGETVVMAWNLYNIHGDRITHVVIEGAEENPDWEVLYDPGLHNATYNVTGQVQEIEEHVGLAPTDVVVSIPDPKPQGYEYVKHPNMDGYIPVMPIDIFIKVPEGAEVLRDYKFVFVGTGNCVTEPGTVIPGIATNLELTISVVSAEPFFETPITGADASPDTTTPEPDLIMSPSSPSGGGSEGAEGTGSGSGESGEGVTGFLAGNATWIGIIGLLVVIILIMGFRGRGRSRSGRGGFSESKYSWKPPSE